MDKKNNFDEKKFAFVKSGLKKPEILKRYEFITQDFLPETFVKAVHKEADYLRFDGHIPTDYNLVLPTATTDKGVAQAMEKIIAAAPSDEYNPAWMLSSIFGGDYDAPYAQRANELMGIKDPKTHNINPDNEYYETWNEIWMGQKLTGSDGLGSFNFDKAKLQETMNKFDIYKGKPEDVATLVKAYNGTINAGVYNDASTGEKELLPIMQKILAPHSNYIDVTALIAMTKDAELAGFLIGGTNGQYAYINDIGTMPKFRKQGLGSLLTASFANYAKKLGAEQLDLDTMEAHNIKLYEKMGFNRWGLTVQGTPKEDEPERII